MSKHTTDCGSNTNIMQIYELTRGRLAESKIKPRVSYVSRRVLPEFVEADTQLQNLPAPLPLDISKSWRKSVVIFENASAEAAAEKPAAPDASTDCYPATAVTIALDHNTIRLRAVPP